MVEISEYRLLIEKLPLRTHQFKTLRSTWNKYETEFEFFHKSCDKIFNGRDYRVISRGQLLDENNLDIKIILTIMWGFPRGPRGHNMNAMLQQFDEIKKILQDVIYNQPSLENVMGKMDGLSRLGIGTFTKLLYSLNIEIDGLKPAILDSVIVSIIYESQILELQPLKRISRTKHTQLYKQYLQILNSISIDLNLSVGKIEMFLFTFGNHLYVPKN